MGINLQFLNMKKLLILLFALPLFSFSTPDIKADIAAGYCSDYCSGYADGVEEARGGITMEEWTRIYNRCVSKCEAPISN